MMGVAVTDELVERENTADLYSMNPDC
jgi:hypothetical protein